MFGVGDYEFEVRISKFEIADSIWQSCTSFFFVKLSQLCSNLFKNGYSGVFEVADYASEIRISKFKTMVKLTNFMFFLEVTMLLGRI